MLDLKNMPDSEFSIAVTPPVPRVAMRVTVDENGKVLLSGKLAEQFSKKPVDIRFNKALTAIQISCLPGGIGTGAIVFPKNGRKTIHSAATLLKQASISLPVVFSSYDTPENGKWRGARQETPMQKPSASFRNTKRK